MSEMYEKSELFGLVERVYAQALIELAEEQNAVDETAGQIEQLRLLVKQQPDAIRLLASRTLSLEDRDALCRKLFEGRVSPLVLRYVRLLVKKNRFDEFPGIAAAFKALVDERHGQIEVQTWTAIPLDQANLDRIARRTRERMNREAVVHQHIDPNLIGGIKVRVRDVVIDGSVATRIKLIKESLLEQGRQSARTKLAQLIH